MCGGGIVQSIEKPFKDAGTLISNPSLKNLENVGHDILPVAETAGLTALGVPLPLAAAGVSGVNSAVRGGSIGQDLLSAGEGAGLAYGGQQLAGEFPETAASINGAIPDLGIGSTLNSAVNSLGFGGAVTPDAVGANVQPGTTAAGTPSNVTAAPASGGTGAGAAGSAAPASIGGASQTDLTSLDSSGFSNVASQLNNSGELGSVGSPVTSTANTGTPSIANNAGTFDFNNPGAAQLPKLGDIGGADVAANNASFDALQKSLPSNITSGAPASAGTAAATPSSFSNFVDNFSTQNAGFNATNAGNAFDVVKANPGATIAAAGLGASALEQGKSLEGERQLKNQANQQSLQGQQLESYLSSGTLPPGIQQGITQAADSAKAQIRSSYAAKGMSGSSAEQQDLAAVDERAQAQGSQMALQLLQAGISESGMSSQLYQALLGNATSQDANLGSAIANFASAASGGGQIGKGGTYKLEAA